MTLCPLSTGPERTWITGRGRDLTNTYCTYYDWFGIDAKFSTRNEDDSIALAFEYTAAVAFDAFIIKREGAEEDYTDEEMEVGSVPGSLPIKKPLFCVSGSHSI